MRALALAIACCRQGFRGETDRASLNIGEVDWPDFLKLVRFHRIEGLAWNALRPEQSALPASVRRGLSQSALRIAAANLQATAECRALHLRFADAGLSLLFLKGLTLGALAYGNPALKSAIDIDLLIDPVDLVHASILLRECGYRLLAPRESPQDRALISWHRGWKESVWGKDGSQIDLHTRTADNSRLIPFINVHSPQRSIDVGPGLELPTLADEELFAYLAVHGASGAWFRLKWISDFAGFLHGKSAEELWHLYRRSQELGAGRSAGQALLLAHELFGTLEHCRALVDALLPDRTIVSLYRTAFRLVSGEPAEPTERPFGTLPIHRTQFQLLPGAGYKLSELSRQAMRLFARAG